MGFNCLVWDQSLTKAEPVKWAGPPHPNWQGGSVSGLEQREARKE